MAKQDQPRIPLNDSQQHEPQDEKANAAGRRVAPKPRQCPICYEGPLNGVGVAYSTQGRKRYYKCPQCGHTWVATVKSVVDRIEHREVDLDERD